ncbi:MAG: PAS domain S-box protein [Methanocalculus sp. MSAO_Arc1]|uniref:PAS domain S-box protein n=1 Tax=Methanocalculus TaxID=71151 RepID=UPI000FF340BA|nr:MULTISPECIES: PAS domain S-box protein [unclassified Methanocalculus]MCP1662180.1 PAS domain S-box-containing protein [Methanocalculus sp. AMF5]RQD79092.1 MAG: PAS domain S-box protein [Methanocalculus sp. MSAO_Arc1]
MDMGQHRVYIVEDEAIIAIDIKSRLMAMGYDVVGTSVSGEDAVEQVRKQEPDIVLMDIVLKGEMDGITAAGIIRDEMAIPVVYLTAFAEEQTINRAKVTEPYGYILKPFTERDLQIAIEIGLYKASAEKKLRESERWISTMIQSMGEGIIATDTEGLIKFMNPAAESLLGHRQEDVIKTPSGVIFVLEPEAEKSVRVDPVLQALSLKRTIQSDQRMILQASKGSDQYVEYTAAPILDADENLMGAVLIFRDITARVKIDEELRRHREELEDLVFERTKELQKANARLEQMLHYIDMAEKRWVEEMLLSEVSGSSGLPSHASEGIVSIDADAHIVLVNYIGEELFGWKQEEAAEQPVSSVLVLENAAGEAIGFPYDQVLKDGSTATLEHDCFLLLRSQEKVPVVVRAEPIRDQTGAIIGASVTLRKKAPG